MPRSGAEIARERGGTSIVTLTGQARLTHGHRDPARVLPLGTHLRALSGLAGALLVLSGCVAAETAGPTGGQAQAGRFDVSLIGDQQYTAGDEARFLNLMDDLNEADLAFVIHTGDFKGAFTPCSDATFLQRKAAFEASRHPFVYTPGDNEWTDCHDPRAGGHDPLERLARLRELFFPGDQSLGRRTLRLTRQSADPAYARFRENARWTYGDVLFTTLHMVGSNNNLGRTPEMDAEYAERNAANLVWLEQAFGLAKRDGHRGIMIIAQANPGFENTWSPRRLQLVFGPLGPMARAPEPKMDTGFDDFLASLEDETLAYGKPVVYVHGDTHLFRIDKPLVGSRSRRTIENLTRVEVFGTPDVHWVRVTIDSRDPGVFAFRSQIVKKNLVNHP